jgi:hypothetical protein
MCIQKASAGAVTINDVAFIFIDSNFRKGKVFWNISFDFRGRTMMS